MRRPFVCLMRWLLAIVANGVWAQGQLPPCPGSYDAATWTNCTGDATSLSGDKYVGGFRNGKYHGRGASTLSSGEKYVGEFKDDKRHGSGTLTFPSGEKYVGEWRDGEYQGTQQQSLAIQALQAQQQRLLALKRDMGRTVPVDSQHQASGDASPQVSGRDLAERSLALLKLQAQIALQAQAFQERPRKRFIGANAKEYRFAQYEEDVRARIERVGTLNYPAEARGKLYGVLRLTVTIRPDGTVDSINLDRSSGHQVLDRAAFRIVQMAAPFAAFPPDIRKDTDLLVITRTWFFAQGDKVRTDDAPDPGSIPPLPSRQSVAAVRPDASGPDSAAVARYRQELMEFARRYRKYPRIALENKWEGRADLRVGIGEDGSISTLTVNKSTGYESLDQEASAIIRIAKSKMTMPTALSGKAFNLEIPVNFYLKDE